MEVCKNINSGKYFIYIDESNNGKALMVNPDAEIKLLELNLFGPVEDINEETLIRHDLITEFQIKRFNEHKTNRSEEFLDLAEYYLEKMSHGEKQRLLSTLEKLIKQN